MHFRRPLAVTSLLVAFALSACGGSGGDASDGGGGAATLVLDFQPNAVHAGIYMALARDYDGGEDVELTVRPPSSSTDSVKLLLSGRADLAILDIHDLAIARAAGRDVVGVMAIVQTPLAAIVTQPGIKSPKDLEGRRVGVSGLPSDIAVLRSIVEGAGGRAERVKRITIGFNAVPALLSKKVAGVTAFWNAEGVALRAQRPGVGEFRVERFGAPQYPELVLSVARATLEDKPGLVKGVVRALRRGYEETLRDPEAAVGALVDANDGLERPLVKRELDAVSQSFTAGASRFGELNRERLRAWATWEQRFGIVKQKPDIDASFDSSVAR